MAGIILFCVQLESNYFFSKYIKYNNGYYIITNYVIPEEKINTLIGKTQKNIKINIYSNILSSNTPIYQIQGERIEKPKAIAYLSNNQYKLAILHGEPIYISKYIE